MRGTFLVGLVLVVFGVLALWSGGIPYRDRTEIVDIGDIEASIERERRFEVAPLLGGAMLVVGLGVMVYGATKRRD